MIKAKHPITQAEITISQNSDGFYTITTKENGSLYYLTEDLKWLKWRGAIYSSVKSAQGFLDAYFRSLKPTMKESSVNKIIEAI